MPNPDVKAVRDMLKMLTWRYRTPLEQAFIDHSLRACDWPDEHPNNDTGYQRCQRDLIASILSDANLLPKEGA